jgi:5-methylcytosine-specific restriction enzyme subunit McrC
VHCCFKSKTYDTKEHRILAAGAAKLLQEDLVEDAYKATAYRWANRAGGRLKQEELRDVVAGLKSRLYTGSRAYYIPALMMARLMLADAGVDLEGEQTSDSEVLLVNMRTLFERYLRATVRNALIDRGLIVDKPEGSALKLFEDGSCSLVPDILVTDLDGSRLIADAKYKIDEPAQESDYYQMCSYLSTYGVSHGVLVFPTLREKRRVSRKTVAGFSITELRVPLEDWRSTEEMLAQEFKAFLGVQ